MQQNLEMTDAGNVQIHNHISLTLPKSPTKLIRLGCDYGGTRTYEHYHFLGELEFIYV